MSKKIKLVVADDHKLIRNGLMQICSLYPDIEIVFEATDGLEALNFVQNHYCDVLLLDINMPNMSGIEAIEHISILEQKPKILLLTAEDDLNTVRSCISLNIDGYILKGSSEDVIIEAIRHVNKGGNFIDQSLTNSIFSFVKGTNTFSSDFLSTLSAKELLILNFISEGYSNKEIASKLFLSEKTIRNYITKLFKKINVSDRVQASIFALKNNIASYI